MHTPESVGMLNIEKRYCNSYTITQINVCRAMPDTFINNVQNFSYVKCTCIVLNSRRKDGFNVVFYNY